MRLFLGLFQASCAVTIARDHLCSHLFRLPRRKQHAPLKRSTQFVFAPVPLHNTTRTVGVESEQQVPQFVGEDVAQNHPVCPSPTADQLSTAVCIDINHRTKAATVWKKSARDVIQSRFQTRYHGARKDEDLKLVRSASRRIRRNGFVGSWKAGSPFDLNASGFEDRCSLLLGSH